MKKNMYLLVLSILLLSNGFGAGAQQVETFKSTSVFQKEWLVDTISRKALVYIPETALTSSTPLIFAFHGRGGTMELSKERYAFHERWPEAIVVYPQALESEGYTMAGIKHAVTTRWQTLPGELNDRDIKYFDVMLRYFRENYKIDSKRIYLTGHSNGGGFVYLLWAERADVFAAIAPTAAAIAKHSPNAFLLNKVQPKPVFIVAGEKDNLVKIEWQKEIIPDILNLNKCKKAGVAVSDYLTLFESKTKNNMMTYIHPGGHGFPPEAAPLIIDFFRKNIKHK
jgi:polyhydroxybutyrate depolymerase